MDAPVSAEITIHGRVQGVGFRPLVCRLAKKLGLTGRVCNAGDHVRIEASGTQEALRQFCRLLRQAPPPAEVTTLSIEVKAYRSYEGFTASVSETDKEKKRIPADLGICPSCLAEMQSAADRRCGYPYISCAQCGPRYTILRYLPYDRENTSMKIFSLCSDCRREYESLADRRSHGETLSCYACGPQLQGYTKEEDGRAASLPDVASQAGKPRQIGLEPAEKESDADRRDGGASGSAVAADEAVALVSSGAPAAQAATEAWTAKAKTLLLAGKIIMVKAVGGFNLVCRADDRAIVARLRDVKKRPSKPFAVMVRDLAAARTLCRVSSAEEALLLSPARPIVLLKKKEACAGMVAENVTDVSDALGVFLPPMGLYRQLTELGPLIVTSGNEAGEPILYRDEEAFAFYASHDAVAGLFTYDREILRPADDSVAHAVNGKPLLLRRGRGYLPEPAVTGAKAAPADSFGGVSGTRRRTEPGSRKKTGRAVLAVGAEMEPGFCLEADGSFYPGIVPGDITLEKTALHYSATVQEWLRLLDLTPDLVVGDLHPGYAATLWGKDFARRQGIPFYQIQHHQAHALSVMGEHGLEGPALAVCFDGTGYGTDGSVWGGEFLLCEGTSFRRLGHVKSTLMLGGDVSMRQAWKTALCCLAAAGEDCGDPRFGVVKAALEQGINSIKNSSAGRLFDAAAFLLGLADFNSHQGRCAMALESAARKALQKRLEPLPMAFREEETEAERQRMTLFDPAPLWKPLCSAGKGATGVLSDAICAAALGFHQAVIQMVTAMAEKVQVEQVVLCGGCFVNEILLQGCSALLRKKGFQVYYNEKVPPGDGGISLGQAFFGMLKNASGIG